MMDQVDHIMSVMESAFDPQWGERWTRRQVIDALAMPNTQAITIDQNGHEFLGDLEGQCAGFLLSRYAADEEELLLIAVHPDFRGAGLGRKLMDMLKDHARKRGTTKIFLEMRSNNPAEHLYRSMGFEPIGRRKDYYLTENGERLDAITFGLSA
jgi:ribosomal-protein-alanine N-acetyltransferase